MRMIVEYRQREMNAVLAFGGDPDWKQSRSTKAPEAQLEEIGRFCTVPSSSKLKELRLAFGTLAREIQGRVEGDQDGIEIGVSPRSRTSGDDIRERAKISSDPIETEETKSSNSNSIESGRVHLPQAGATEDCNGFQGGSRKRETSSSFRSIPPNVGKKLDGASKVQDIRSLESNQEDTRVESMVRLKAVVYTPGHDITEVSDGNARREVTQVRAELESERRSTQAARRALQEAQRVAEEALVERDKLAYAVKTYEERSQKESSIESQSLKQQVRESERSLVEARLQIDTKTREMMEALERAADLGEALKKERTARVAAVEEQKKLTRHLRTCLRDRAKAEEEASKASKALQQSKTQMESLTRRLEVLRSAKKRLDKKVAAAAPGANSYGEVGSATTGVHDRLVEARARLRTLSKITVIDNGGNGGRGHGSDQYFVKDPTKTAVEIALKTALLDKKWTEKLHDAEKRGEAYRSAALATETEVQKVVKEKEELAEKNRILSERLAEFSWDEYSPKCKQDTESVATSLVTTRTEKSQFSRETNSFLSRSEMKSGDLNQDSCKDDGTKAEVDFKTSRREIPKKLLPAHQSLKMYEERRAAPLTTPTAPPMTSNDTRGVHISRNSKSVTALGVKTAEKANDNSIEADRKTTRRYTQRTARSNSLDAVERPVPFRSWCDARPRSASQEARSNCDAPCIAHGQHKTAMFNHLLTDSRRLRVDVLRAMRNWSWREGLRGNHVANRPNASLQAPALEQNVVSASAVGIDKCDRTKDTSIAPVPIAVLLRLCDRSARLAKGERENINTQVIEEGRKETLATGCEYGVLSVTQAQPTTNAEEPAEDDQLLPAGVSAALAQQVRCAVSKGDETGFLQIIGQCGSTARWGIARLLAINPS